MEDKINMKFNFSGIEELREAEKIYRNCFKIEGWDVTKYPSLKYTYCCTDLSDAFIDRLNKLKDDIIDIKEKLINYKDDKIKEKLEIEGVEEIINKLISLERQVNEENEYYCDYLITITKRSDVMKSEIAKNIYINISEDIINSRIKTLLKYEKNFIIYKDKLNILKKFLS